MTMNKEQFLSLIRGLLAAVGPSAALAIQLGMPEDAANGWVKVIQAILGIGTIVASIVWGNSVHTDANAAAVAGVIPGVSVSVNPQAASAEVTAVATDPAKPGVNLVPPGGST